MRKFVVLGLSVWAVTASAGPSLAYEDGPWCARSWGGSDYVENCNMQSFAMCLAEIRGSGGSTVCSPNPNERHAAPGRRPARSGRG